MITTRNATREDIPTLYAILNEVVEIGGTTAFVPPFSQTDFETYFMTERMFSMVVAIDEAGDILGWQTLDAHELLPKDVGDIGSYAKLGHVGQGIGTKMFEHTVRNARECGLAEIHAAIRADNQSGLTYYSKMGLTDCDFEPNFTLKTGEVVGRISKRFDLG